MQRYNDNILARSGGYVIPAAGASVTVKNYPAGTVATIYSDDGVTPKTNPIVTGTEGEFFFYAADGRYSLEISGGGYTGGNVVDITLDGLGDTDVDTLRADLASTSSGKGTDLVYGSARVVNVRDFGAVGDGVTDDSAAANTAAGQGVVYFPQGNYLLDDTMVFYYGLYGDGVTRTRLIHGVNAPNDNWLKLGGSNAAYAGATCRDLTIDGNYPNVTAAFLYMDLLMYPDSIVQRILMKNCRARGIDVGSLGTRAKILDSVFVGVGSATEGSQDAIWGVVPDTEGILIRGNSFYNWRNSAIFVSGSGTIIDGNTVHNCHLQTTPVGGGQIACGSVDKINTVSNNYVGTSTGTASSGLELNGRVLALGNTLVGQQQNGIILQDASHYDIVGNTIKNGNASAIFVTAGVTDFLIANNHCYDEQSPKTQTYGIKIDAGASDRYNIVGNNLNGNLTAALLDGGTGTEKNIVGNTPAIAEEWIVFTAAITQVATPTITVNYARYRLEGKTCRMELKITGTAGTAGTTNNAIQLSGWPAHINPRFIGSGTIIGTASIFKAGVAWYIGAVVATNATTMQFMRDAGTNYIGIDPNISFATGDVLSISLCYEVA